MVGSPDPRDPKPDDPILPVRLPYLSFQSLTPFRKTAPHLNTGILNPKTCPSCRLQGLSEGISCYV